MKYSARLTKEIFLFILVQLSKIRGTKHYHFSPSALTVLSFNFFSQFSNWTATNNFRVGLYVLDFLLLKRRDASFPTPHPHTQKPKTLKNKGEQTKHEGAALSVLYFSPPGPATLLGTYIYRNPGYQTKQNVRNKFSSHPIMKR